MPDALFTVENRIEVARANTMRAARLADERGDPATHRHLMLVADALDDADDSAKAFDFKRHLMAEASEEPRLRAVPTPWRKR